MNDYSADSLEMAKKGFRINNKKNRKNSKQSMKHEIVVIISNRVWLLATKGERERRRDSEWEWPATYSLFPWSPNRTTNNNKNDEWRSFFFVFFLTSSQLSLTASWHIFALVCASVNYHKLYVSVMRNHSIWVVSEKKKTIKTFQLQVKWLLHDFTRKFPKSNFKFQIFILIFYFSIFHAGWLQRRWVYQCVSLSVCQCVSWWNDSA